MKFRSAKAFVEHLRVNPRADVGAWAERVNKSIGEIPIIPFVLAITTFPLRWQSSSLPFQALMDAFLVLSIISTALPPLISRLTPPHHTIERIKRFHRVQASLGMRILFTAQVSLMVAWVLSFGLYSAFFFPRFGIAIAKLAMGRDVVVPHVPEVMDMVTPWSVAFVVIPALALGLLASRWLSRSSRTELESIDIIEVYAAQTSP